MKRVESLDYLRGLMALSVMAYHYVLWSLPQSSLGGGCILGRLGVYAVSVFYILSGLSLAMVYHSRITSWKQVKVFLIKRVFRIFPLLWLSLSTFIFFQLAASLMEGKPFGITLYDVIINYSLLFSFIDHDAYLTPGAWSIGNELVFYAILPIVFWFSTKYKHAIVWFFSLSCLAGLYFGFIALDPELDLSSQWGTYINPFNQIFLFAGGVMIGVYGHVLKRMKRVLFSIVFVLAVVGFCFIPAPGDQIRLVSSWCRIVFPLCCFGIVSSVYILNPILKPPSSRIFSFFGESCYSIYLLHPLVAIPVVFISSKTGVDKPYAYTISFFLTLMVSWVSYRVVEKPMMLFGRQVIETVNFNRTHSDSSCI